jgi:hypothetical protein
MKLQAIVNDVNSVPEGLRDAYTKGDDGQFYLSIEGLDAHPTVAGLKHNRDTLMDEKKALSKTVDKYRDVDLEEYQRLRDAEEQSRHEKLVKKGDLDTFKAEYEAKLQSVKDAAAKEVATAQEEAEAEREAARVYFRDGEVSRALSGKAPPELVGHVINSMIEVKRGEDGKFALSVLGPGGTSRYKDSKGTPFGIADLVDELKENPVYARAFDPSGRHGSESRPNQNSGTGGTRVVSDFGANIEDIAVGKAVYQPTR